MLTQKSASDQTGRLGGARADFVASLGRKIGDLRKSLGAAAQTSDDSGETRKVASGDFRRKLHALSAGARLLRFEALERAIADGIGIADRASHEGGLSDEDITSLGALLEDMPALAWGEAPKRGESHEPPNVEDDRGPSYSALVVGNPRIGDALTERDPDGLRFECECTPDAQKAVELARTMVPDVVVIDADVDSAIELVEALMDDPLTEPVPTIVIGSFAVSGSAASFVALGVTKTLGKPISHAALRRACEESIFQREGRTMKIGLGEPTVQQLGERLAEELRHALVDAVDQAQLDAKVPLGEATEVLGAVWGAIARIREVITARTDGAVRFSNAGPEGAIALAPSLDTDVARGSRGLTHVRGNGPEIRLAGRRVLVADDDPGVTWFIADLLRAAGCEVTEAMDGEAALEKACATSPDVVVSDILMPKMDGFALCRAMKRDVVLRDVPVILLSWKEDLLQRVRELGAGAAAYMRKESDARAMVARIREALRQRSRIEGRLRAIGEIRGRLDGLTVTTLLKIVCDAHQAARVSVRDASFLYEVEIRDHAPVRATRTAGDGSFKSGPRVLAAMLGVGAGRFIVGASGSPIQAELVGELMQQLARPVATARAATRLVTGPNMMTTSSIELDEEAVRDYLRATPERARSLIRALLVGTSPRELVMEGACDAGLLEEVLADLAMRGAVLAVQDDHGADALPQAVDRALALVDSRSRGLIGATPSPRPASRVTTHVTENSAPPIPVIPSERAPAAELHERSPVSSVFTVAKSDALSAPAPSVSPPPPADDALGGPTDVDDAPYARDGSVPIPIDHASAPLSMDEIRERENEDGPIMRIEETPLASVAAREIVGPRPGKSRAIYVAVIVLAISALVWAMMRGAIARPASRVLVVDKVVGAEPPPEAQAIAPAIPATATDVIYTELPVAAGVEPGQGLLEIAPPEGATVRVDGTEHARASLVTIPVWAGAHDIRVGEGAGERARLVEVRAGARARVQLMGP